MFGVLAQSGTAEGGVSVTNESKEMTTPATILSEDEKLLSNKIVQMKEREQQLMSLQNSVDERLREITLREKQLDERALKLKQYEDELKLKEVHNIQQELLFNQLKEKLNAQQHTLGTRYKNRILIYPNIYTHPLSLHYIMQYTDKKR
jgi:TolA-binding protein